jgi:hypothetical protein
VSDKYKYSDNWTDWDSEAASVGFDFDAVERAVFCDSGKEEKCLEEYEEINKPHLRVDSHCICIKHLAKQLLFLRLEDPILFDYFCIKTCYPEFSYEDILKVFKGMEHDSIQIDMRMIGRHRARVAEIDAKVKQIYQEKKINIDVALLELRKRISKMLKIIKNTESEKSFYQLEFKF